MSHDSEAMALHEYICSMICLVLLVRCMLPELTAVPRHRYFLCLVWLEAFEKTALSAASHKDHDGEVEHDDDCAHDYRLPWL